MHVAFLLTQSLAGPSGLGRYWPLAKELNRLGHRVTVLALHPAYSGLAERRFKQDGVNVWYVSQMHVQKTGSHKHYFGTRQLLSVTALATWRLTAAALRTPADVYHVAKAHPMNSIAGLVASRLRRKPLYLDCDDYEAGSNRFNSAWQQRIVAFFEDHLPRWTAGVSVNTRFTAKRLQDLNVPRKRVVYVPNGVERERFAKVASGALREELGLTGRPVILYLGSMSLTSHAVDLLLEAFARVLAELPEAILLLVGGGEDLDELQHQARALRMEENVRFTGRVQPDAAAAYYRLADVSVDPVRDDAASQARSPLKVVESLVSGTPVVTGDVGDRCLQLAHGGGLLVPPGDALALAEALIAVLKDRELRDRLSAEALAEHERHYWDVLIHDFVRIYDRAG